MSSLIAAEETIEVPSVGGRPPRVLPRTVLSDILQPRVDEIFTLVRDEIERCGLTDTLASGLVVTGGSTILQGLPELAEEILGMPVRRGTPAGVGGLSEVVRSPIYATAVGLLLYGARQQNGLFAGGRTAEGRGVWRRMRSWFAEVF
jgi:cell division protein FtsA